MKKLLSYIVVAVLSLSVLGSTGCKTVDNPTGVIVIGDVTIDPAVTGTAAKIAAKLGALSTINAQPNSRQYFIIARDVINAAIATGNYNPTNIQSTITAMTGNSLAASSIVDAITLYQQMYGQIVTAGLTDKSPYVVPVLTGIANGIDDAIKLTEAGPAVSTRPTTPVKLVK